MTSAPLLSVFMPVFNASAYLAPAIASVLEQDFRDFELIIIDDGSTDGSRAYLEGLRDSRIRLYFNARNEGVTATTIKGMKLARGALLARMDSDDISELNRFSLQVAAMTDDPDLILIGSGAQAFGAWEFHWQTPETPDALRAYLLFDCPFPHSSVIMRIEAMTRLGLAYDPSMEAAEDYDLWERAASRGKIAAINQILVRYRVHQESLSNRISERVPFFADKVRRRALHTHLGFELLDDDVIPMRRLSGVYQYRFARTGAELRAVHNLYLRLRERMLALLDRDNRLLGEACLQEMDARWRRTFNWATESAREEAEIPG